MGLLGTIGLLAPLAVFVINFMQWGKIRRGWTDPKFKGSREEFVAAHARALQGLLAVGLLVATVFVGLAFMNDDSFSLVVAGAWAVCGLAMIPLARSLGALQVRA
jgi:hypothetical protein